MKRKAGLTAQQKGALALPATLQGVSASQGDGDSGGGGGGGGRGGGSGSSGTNCSGGAHEGGSVY